MKNHRLPNLSLLAISLSLVGCCSVKQASLPELPPGRIMQVGGHNLFLRQTGVGPDVVLLHGLGDSSIGWQFIEPGLVRAGYRVTVWDALGAGRSEKPACGDYSIQAHVQRLEEMLDALRVRDAVLVGHSLGGSEALLFANRHPGKVRALCLVDPAAYRAGVMGGRWFWNIPLLPEAVLGLVPLQTITTFGLNQNFHNHNAISANLRLMYLREARREGAIRTLIRQERQVVPPDADRWERGHRAIRMPALILWGEDDKLVPRAQGRRLAVDISGAQLTVLPGVGHAPQLEVPQLMLDHLLPFLKNVGF